MAKLGPKDEGKYDPFSAISDSLTALTEPPVPKQVAAPTVLAEAPGEEPQTTPRVGIVARSELVLSDRGGGGVGPRGAKEPSTKLDAPSAALLKTVKRFKTSREEAARIDLAAVSLSARLGISIDQSKLTRALWDAYLRHEDDILRNIQEGVTWERPPNSDAVGLAELDEKLADLINDGLMVASRRPKNIR